MRPVKRIITWMGALAVAGGLGLLPAAAQRVVLVQGTVSHRDAAERNIARRMTEVLDHALSPYGLDHAVITEEALTETRLRGVSVAILPYNGALPAAQRDALLAFLKRGGRLIVFYSNDAQLARAMGFKLGAYQPMAVAGQWAAFRFTPDAPPHLPARVVQTSRNIRPALPDAPHARVIAWWDNRAGARGDSPAWAQSSQGFWMSHILNDNGDTTSKEQLLLGLLGHCDPALWTLAAGAYLRHTAGFRDQTEFEAGLAEIAARPGRHQPGVPAALNDARRARARAEAAHAAGRHPEAIALAREALRARVEAYALTFAPQAGERRGVWDHSGAGLYPGDWTRTMVALEAGGVTDLFINALWPGVAHFDSRVVPRSDTFRVHGDQVTACLAAARPRGIRVHIWKVCWRLETAPADLVARFRREGRLQLTDAGETIPWLCPSHPENLQYEKDAIRDLLSRYDVAGVHLDYIRFRDSRVCYCAGCRQRFTAATGAKITDWPAQVRRAPMLARYETWRAGRITRLVKDVRTFGHRIRPDLEVSAAVFGGYPLCIRSVGQDWGQWLEQGDADFIAPMNYNNDAAKFEALVTMQMGLPGAPGRIWPGIGVTAAESRLDAVAVLDQLAIARRAGATGYVLFDLNHRLEHDILPAIGLTAGRPRPVRPD